MPKCFVQVLGTGTRGFEPGLMVFFDSKRYMFNCGEGTQRFCTEHKIRLNRIECFFMTQLSWEKLGGLPGALLTVTDVGINQVSVFGPEYLTQALFSTRYFLVRPRLQLQVREFLRSTSPESMDPPAFQDENLKLFPIILEPKDESVEDSTSETEATTRRPLTADYQYYFHPSALPQSLPSGFSTASSSTKPQPTPKASKTSKNNNSRTPTASASVTNDSATSSTSGNNTSEAAPAVSETAWMQQNPEEVINLRRSLPTPQGNPSSRVVCYICKTADAPGKFDMQKAKSLGLKPGPICGELVKGNPVTLEDGRIIQPSDCIAPAERGPVFFVIECPSVQYLSSLLNAPGFDPYRLRDDEKPGERTIVDFIFHFTPPEVIIHQDYQRWMQSFGPQAQHIVANSHHCPSRPIFIGTATKHVALHQVHPQIFPKESLHQHVALQLAIPNVNSVPADNLLKIHLQPPTSRGLDRSELVGLIDEAAIKQQMDQDALISSLLKRYQESCSLAGFPIDTTPRHRYEEAADTITKKNGEYEIYFLGTGAAIPSRYRNVSSVYLSIHGHGSLLFDAGEGTYGQLYRLFGELGINQALLNLKAIFISHMHADHHLGAIRILTRRQELLQQLQSSPSTSTKGGVQDPLLVIGPVHFGCWLEEYSMLQPLSYQFRDCGALLDSPGLLRETLGIARTRAVEVIHCPNSYGFVVEYDRHDSSTSASSATIQGEADAWKIVYSGDTRPCDELVEAGKDATVLIHEATFESEMTTDAVEKAHSTTLEAITIGARMNAKLTILTHFSQRYPKVAPLPKNQVETQGTNGRYGAIAFDLMTVRGERNFKPLELMIPLLQQLFREEDEDEAQRSPPTSSSETTTTSTSTSTSNKGAAAGQSKQGQVKGKPTKNLTLSPVQGETSGQPHKKPKR